MTEPLYKLTSGALDWLITNFNSHVKYYDNPDSDFNELLSQYCEKHSVSNYRIRTKITLEHPIKLNMPKPDQNPNKSDIQALEFYNNLNGMTPSLASDPCILSYINLFYMHKYNLMRWPQDNSNKSYNHWLGYSSRAIYESSTAGRMWWLAYISITSAENSGDEFTAEEILKKFANTAEYYHRTMQIVVLQNPLLRAELARMLFRHDSITVEQYRQIAGELNQEAGTRLLDALDRQSIREMIERITHRIVSKTGN